MGFGLRAISYLCPNGDPLRHTGAAPGIDAVRLFLTAGKVSHGFGLVACRTNPRRRLAAIRQLAQGDGTRLCPAALPGLDHCRHLMRQPGVPVCGFDLATLPMFDGAALPGGDQFRRISLRWFGCHDVISL
jgi:hypothetical protein